MDDRTVWKQKLEPKKANTRMIQGCRKWKTLDKTNGNWPQNLIYPLQGRDQINMVNEVSRSRRPTANPLKEEPVRKNKNHC